MPKIDKPWGHELILTSPDLPYSGKILFLLSGKRISYQYHDQKTETLVLLAGQATITLNDQDTPMQLLTPYTILPGTKHRLSAHENCQIIEFATPEIGTTFRLEDDFRRGDETNSVRNSPNRGWRP